MSGRALVVLVLHVVAGPVVPLHSAERRLSGAAFVLVLVGLVGGLALLVVVDGLAEEPMGSALPGVDILRAGGPRVLVLSFGCCEGGRVHPECVQLFEHFDLFNELVKVG